MDLLRESFQRVRQDISSLREEIGVLKLSLIELNWKIDEMINLSKEIKSEIKLENEEKKPTNFQIIPSTHIIQIPTNPLAITTDTFPFKTLNTQKQSLSIGNKGVQTDRQTDRQTDNSTQNINKISSNQINQPSILSKLQTEYDAKPPQHDPIQNAADILDSLDALKKEIRLKFKRLTEREWSVFSTIYQLEEEKGFSDYKSIAERLKLTESSIRDYVARLLEKGISLDKIKLNNKTLQFKISPSLKRVATLPTIMQLRDL
ncbi:response regulator transcription factor [Candidatus Pacearchaeota archaeon]|nr:response regulator transcription factor [Candidatus Pacearchaeota archaeon]